VLLCNGMFLLTYIIMSGLACIVLYKGQTENGYPLFSVLESVWSLASRTSIQSLHFGKAPVVPPSGVLAFYALHTKHV